MVAQLNPANNTYEVLRVQSYLASGGFAHVFMAKQVLADGGLGRFVCRQIDVHVNVHVE